MTYEEIIPIAKKGKLIKLPYWDGYFKWNYQLINQNLLIMITDLLIIQIKLEKIIIL